MDCFDPFVFSIGNFIDGQKVDVSQSDPGYLPEKKRNKYHREKKYYYFQIQQHIPIKILLDEI